MLNQLQTKAQSGEIQTVWVATPDDPKNRLEFNVGDIHMVVDKITITKSAAITINWESPEKIVLIGTVGSDFVEGKVIAMNYPKGTIRWSVSGASESISSDADLNRVARHSVP